MKKSLLIGLLMLCFVVMTACGGGSGNTGGQSSPATEGQNAGNTASGPAQKVQLKFSSFAAAQHDLHTQHIEPFLKKIEEVTEGRVTGTLYPGSALGPADVQFDLVVSGAADMALGAHGYNAGRFPLSGVVELPFMGNSAEQSSVLLWKLMEKFPEEFAKEHEGVKVGWFVKNDGYQIFSSKKPIQAIEDLKGMRIRTPGPGGTLILEALGAVPVSMPMPDVYEALQRGVIDGALAPASVIHNYKMGDVAKYITRGDFMSISHYIAINPSTWAKLSPEDQEAINALMGEAMSAEGGRIYDEDAEKGWKAAEEAGVEVYELTAEELAQWKAALEPIAEKWITDMEGKGLPGRAVYDEALKILESM